MKFEYDHKMGTMMPKKNPQIYFNRAMSGGLRIDDEINKIKYVIERNGDIKFISGGRHEVNIYDQRNAHIIADRVKRMFGPDHKYSNYKLFTKGYHVIESYEEYTSRVNEGLWKSGVRRSQTGDIRKEEGIKVIFPLGKVILKDLGCGLPYKLNPDDNQYWYYIESNDMYIFGYDNDGEYTYFKYDEDNEDEDSYHLTQLATSDYDMTEDDFVLIKAMLDLDSSYEGMIFKTRNDNCYTCEFDDDNKEYVIYDDYDAARDAAIENTKNLIDDIGTDEKSLDRWRGSLGDDFIDTDAMKEWQREDYDNYVNDIENENGEHGNRLYDELMDAGFIEDTDEYFERVVDDVENEDEEDEGYLDYDSPLFDIDSMKEKLVDKLCDGYNDVIDWYTGNFGTDGLENFIDNEKLAEMIVDSDGIGNSIASYDGDEFNFSEDGYDIYIYRTN